MPFYFHVGKKGIITSHAILWICHGSFQRIIANKQNYIIDTIKVKRSL